MSNLNQVGRYANDPWAQPLSMMDGWAGGQTYTTPGGITKVNRPTGPTIGGRPGVRQDYRSAPQQLTPQQQYEQRMQQLDMEMKQMNTNNSWQMDQYKNARFAGANPGAQAIAGVAGPWGDSAAQSWWNMYMVKNLGLDNSNSIGRPISGASQSGSSNPFNRAQAMSRRGA